MQGAAHRFVLEQGDHVELGVVPGDREALIAPPSPVRRGTRHAGDAARLGDHPRLTERLQERSPQSGADERTFAVTSANLALHDLDCLVHDLSPLASELGAMQPPVVDGRPTNTLGPTHTLIKQNERPRVGGEVVAAVRSGGCR